MRQQLRSHLTYANVISSLALFLVLTGGAAYALDGSNTVFSDDIVDGQVKEADVGQGAVASSEVKNDSIQNGDVAPNTLTSGRIADGTVTGADVQNGGLTGNDLAANSIPTGRITDESLTGADVKNNALKGADIDESTLDVGDAARAYAAVDANTCTTGICTVTQSKGISSVTRGDTGTYCVTAPGIDASVTPAAVTVDWQHTQSPEGNASAMSREGNDCAGGGFVVVTERQPEISVDEGGGTDNAIASGSAEQTNLVSFTIVIP